ncbi:hypothetical protein [Kitasatospora indigofera]|uniref:hypothetical protein n=1 Tax=Kitasatospora indigofera TaxID=67307 RepID=UPI0036758CF2
MLNYLVKHHGGKAEAFLKRVGERHQRLGFGNFATNKQKLHRWRKGTKPDREAQLALAHLLNVPRRDVLELGWPAWLERAVPDVLLAPHRATPTALKARKAGETVERRRFMITPRPAAWPPPSPPAPVPAAGSATASPPSKKNAW